MKSFAVLSAIVVVLACAFQKAAAFVPYTHASSLATVKQQKRSTTNVFGFLGDKERDALTRDSEPEQYFQT
jgi:hypothetical protein